MIVNALALRNMTNSRVTVNSFASMFASLMQTLMQSEPTSFALRELQAEGKIFGEIVSMAHINFQSSAVEHQRFTDSSHCPASSVLGSQQIQGVSLLG